MVIRSTFFSLGMFIVLWGTVFFLVDRILIDPGTGPLAGFPLWSVISSTSDGQTHELSPPAWAPYGMLAVGMITMLYSFSLPKKQG